MNNWGGDQFLESAKLEGEIKKNLAGLGYEFPAEASNVG
jgi:hypothetical protein